MSYLFQRFKDYLDEDKILVYQMGKVGSTTLESQIKGSIHLHTLYNNNPCFIHAKARRGKGFSKVKHFFFDLLRLLAIKIRKKVKIITVIRNPIDRDLSMFFQDLPFWLSHHVIENKVQTKEDGYGLLVDAFHQTYDSEYSLLWFDREIKRLSGIDVFDVPFDKNKGWNIYKNGKYEVLLLEVKKISESRSVIEEFTGVKILGGNSNVGEKKWYSCVYKDFKSNVDLSDDYVNKVKGSRYYSHFYGE